MNASEQRLPLCSGGVWSACAGRVQALLPARVLPECEGRRGRACLAASICLMLLLLVAALSAPWWATWLLWRPSRTSFVTLPAGERHCQCPSPCPSACQLGLPACPGPSPEWCQELMARMPPRRCGPRHLCSHQPDLPGRAGGATHHPQHLEDRGALSPPVNLPVPAAVW